MAGPDWREHELLEVEIEAVKKLVRAQAQTIDGLTTRVLELEKARDRDRLNAVRRRVPPKIAP